MVVQVDPRRVQESEERFRKSGKLEQEQIVGQRTLGNNWLQELTTPAPKRDHTLRSKNWFPAKVSDIISDVEWAIQFTCCRVGGSKTCTEESCPSMEAGGYEFPWQDTKDTPVVRVTAPRFCHKLVQWSTQMRTAPNFWDEMQKFTNQDQEWRMQVEPTVKLLMYRILCVYSHILHHHWVHHHKAKTEEHFNHVFKHFIWFTTECDLLSKAELAPLKPVIDSLFAKEYAQGQGPKA